MEKQEEFLRTTIILKRTLILNRKKAARKTSSF